MYHYCHSYNIRNAGIKSYLIEEERGLVDVFNDMMCTKLEPKVLFHFLHS